MNYHSEVICSGSSQGSEPESPLLGLNAFNLQLMHWIRDIRIPKLTTEPLCVGSGQKDPDMYPHLVSILPPAQNHP